jgi:hypothetical protein
MEHPRKKENDDLLLYLYRWIRHLSFSAGQKKDRAKMINPHASNKIVDAKATCFQKYWFSRLSSAVAPCLS